MAECTCADPTAVVRAINQHADSQKEVVKQYIASDTEYNWHQSFYGADMGNEENAGTGGGGGSRGAKAAGDVEGTSDAEGSSEAGGCSKSGKPGAPAPIRFCHWQAPEYGNKGENWWTMLFRAAAIAIAVANGIAQQEIADKQQDLADSWYQQAKYKWDRYAGTYIPLEKKLLNEVSSTPVPQLDCAGAESRAQQAVDSAYGQAGDYMARQAKTLRLCVDSSLLGYVNLKQNVALVDGRNYNYVDDRWFRDYKDDQRWNRRSNVLNLGRNLDSQALSYGQVANALYGQVGQQIDRAANGLITALGYFGARNDTYYSTTYLGSGGSPVGQLVSIGAQAAVNPTAANPAGVG